MKVLHLASFDRWTGAAAPAFVEADALRKSGIDAAYGYVGGYLLEKKIGDVAWAEPLLQPGHGPVSVFRTLTALRRMIRSETFDLVHTHLSHDHWIARFAVAGTNARLVRTFHSPRALRTDPFTRWLVRSTNACAVINPTLASKPLLAGAEVIVTPPPLEPQYVPEGETVRDLYGVGDEPLIGVIGKLSPGRGFEDAIESFALIRHRIPESRLMIIGHGPHRPTLESVCNERGVSDGVIWAGYHEHDLPEHFRAMDLMLFTAAGSDHGHRAIIEANGCGTPVVAYPIDGVRFIVGQQNEELVATECSPSVLSSIVIRLLSASLSGLSTDVVRNARRFDYANTVERLRGLYSRALSG